MTQTELRPTTDAESPDHGCACAAPCGSRGRSVTRRAAIGAGVVAGAAFVTACGSSDSPAATSTTSTSTSASSTGATSSAASSTAAGTTAGSGTSESSGTSSAASSAAPAPSGTEIAKLADVPSGGSLIVDNGGDAIALARNADGTVVAHSAICTHQGCAVNADGAVLACPCHGSTFDAFSGAATKGPATVALEAVTVEVSGDAVYLTA